MYIEGWIIRTKNMHIHFHTCVLVKVSEPTNDNFLFGHMIETIQSSLWSQVDPGFRCCQLNQSDSWYLSSRSNIYKLIRVPHYPSIIEYTNLFCNTHSKQDVPNPRTKMLIHAALHITFEIFSSLFDVDHEETPFIIAVDLTYKFPAQSPVGVVNIPTASLQKGKKNLP